MTLWDYLMIFLFVVGMTMFIVGIFTYQSNRDKKVNGAPGPIQWYTYLLLIGGLVLAFIALIYGAFRLFNR
jgi:hypothetical protein